MPSSLPHAGLAHDAAGLVKTAWRVDPRRMLGLVALLVVAGVVGGANLLLLVAVMSSVAASGTGGSVDVPGLGSLGLSGAPVPALLAGVVVLAAVQAIVQRAGAMNAHVVQESVTQEMRTRAYDAVLGARWSFILARQRSDIISVVATGSQRAGHALGQLLAVAVTAVTATATAVVALIVEPVLAGVAVAGTVVLGAILGSTIARAYRMGDRFSSSARDVQSVMTHSLDSFRLVRAHDAAAVWRRELAGALAESRQVQVAHVRHTATLSAVCQVGLVASAGGLVLVAVQLGAPPPTIVVVLLLVARLSRLVQSLAATVQAAAFALPAVGDIEELTRDAAAAAEIQPIGDAPGSGAPATDLLVATGAGSPGSAVPGEAPAPRDATPTGGLDQPLGGILERAPSPLRPGSGRGRGARAAVQPGDPLISLRGVSFRYPSGGGGVSDISFELTANGVIALTGPSGSGRSTIADIVLGLLEPDSGQVLVDGEPLVDAGLREWRARVAYVPQETVLIPGTLRRNLLWSVGGADDAACWHALDRSAAAFARSLPDGLDTELGDRGIRLSGGERQHVAIARALLRRPDLLVLDEATSSLDDTTESAILDSIAALRPEMAVLVIAQRRSTISMADHVVRLKQGRVAAVSSTLW